MTIKDQILQRLEEARASGDSLDPLDGEYKARLKKLTQLKWDPAKSSYEKPGAIEKEGASISVSGLINGKNVVFKFWYPEVVARRMITGWIFMGVSEGTSYNLSFDKTEQKISEKISLGPPIKRMGAWKAIPEADRRANLKELDDAIRKYS